MKAFKFSLASILTLREREEERALEVYSAKLQEKEAAEARLVEIADALEAQHRAYRDALKHAICASNIIQFTNYTHRINEAKVSHCANVKICQSELDVALQIFLMARQSKEILLNLKQKEEKRHRDLMATLERKFIDDIVSSRAARATMAASN